MNRSCIQRLILLCLAPLFLIFGCHDGKQKELESVSQTSYSKMFDYSGMKGKVFQIQLDLHQTGEMLWVNDQASIDNILDWLDSKTPIFDEFFRSQAIAHDLTLTIEFNNFVDIVVPIFYPFQDDLERTSFLRKFNRKEGKKQE